MIFWELDGLGLGIGIMMQYACRVSLVISTFNI